MKKVNFKNCVIVLAIGLMMTSCGVDDDDDDDDGYGGTTVNLKITGISDPAAVLIYPTKPIQWYGVDENDALAWCALQPAYKPEETLFQGIPGNPLIPQPYTGGSGYVFLILQNGDLYNTFISKNKITFTAGTKTLNLANDFEILHEFDGYGIVTVTNLDPLIDNIFSISVYYEGIEDDHCIATSDDLSYRYYFKDFSNIPIGKAKTTTDERYSGTKDGMLVYIFIAFEGETPDKFKDNDGNEINGWQIGDQNFVNGCTTIDWRNCVPIPSL